MPPSKLKMARGPARVPGSQPRVETLALHATQPEREQWIGEQGRVRAA